MPRKKRQKKSKILRKQGEKLTEELINEMQGRVAVYIDAANLEKSVQELGLIPPKHIARGIRWKADKNLWHVDYKKLHRFFKKNTTLASINFYTARFGTKSHDRFLTFLKRNGYRLVTKEIKSIADHRATVSRRCKYCGSANDVSIKFKCSKCGKLNITPIERKADFDVEISVDVADWKDNYDTFVLFSGDSDFVYLVSYLKKENKKTIVLSRRGHIANELRKSKDVDYYQDIYKLRREFLKRNP